jgi:hypothetical protein
VNPNIGMTQLKVLLDLLLKKIVGGKKITLVVIFLMSIFRVSRRCSIGGVDAAFGVVSRKGSAMPLKRH